METRQPHVLPATHAQISFKRQQQCNGTTKLKQKIRKIFCEFKAKKAVVSKIVMEDGRSPLVKKLQAFGTVPLTINEKRTILQ